MMHIVESLSAEDLEAQLPLLQNLAGTEFDYMSLGAAVWNSDLGVTSGVSALAPEDPQGDVTKAQRDLWGVFVGELYSFLCTEAPRYADLRKRVAALKGQPASVVVGAVAGAVGATMGLSAGVITPFVALLLHGAVSLGMNTMCQYRTQEYVQEQ